MIQGTGFDLAALPRIQNMLEKYGERFLARLLTPKELAALPAPRAARVAYVAGRFAAKEAAVCPFCGSAFIVEKAIQNYNIERYSTRNCKT